MRTTKKQRRGGGGIEIAAGGGGGDAMGGGDARVVCVCVPTSRPVDFRGCVCVCVCGAGGSRRIHYTPAGRLKTKGGLQRPLYVCDLSCARALAFAPRGGGQRDF